MKNNEEGPAKKKLCTESNQIRKSSMSADGKEVSDPKTATSSGNAQESNVIDDQVLPIHEAPDHGHQADESPRKLKKKLHESNKKL